MGNTNAGAGGKDNFSFRPGYSLSASDLNMIVERLAQRLVGTAPIRVTASPRGVAISLDDNTPRGSYAFGVPGVVTGTSTNTATPADGDYLTVDLYAHGRSNPSTDTVQAFSTDPSSLPTGSVGVFKTLGGVYYAAASGGSPVVFAQITGLIGGGPPGHYDWVPFNTPVDDLGDTTCWEVNGNSDSFNFPGVVFPLWRATKLGDTSPKWFFSFPEFGGV